MEPNKHSSFYGGANRPSGDPLASMGRERLISLVVRPSISTNSGPQGG
jgi:hypothetical protein